MAQWDEQFSKLKQIIEMMKDHNLVEIQIKQGEEELCVKKAQPVQQITAVPMFGAGIARRIAGGGGSCDWTGARTGIAGGQARGDKIAVSGYFLRPAQPGFGAVC